MSSGPSGSQFAQSRRIISRSSFTGDDIDPAAVQPFFFGGGSKAICQKGVQHCENLLSRREISGRSRNYLQMIQRKYEEGRRSVGQPPKQLQEEIETLEKMWESHWEKVYGPECQNEVVEQLHEEIKRTKFLAAIGDYLEPICAELKQCKLPNEQKNEFRTFQYWADCLAFLEKEDQKFENGEESHCPLRETVVAVAHEMNVDEEMVRFWISLYAERNRTFHSGLKDHIAESRWEKLAVHIETDIKDIALITPEAKKGDIYHIKKTINHFQTLYFRSVYRGVGETLEIQLTQRAVGSLVDYHSGPRVRKQRNHERRNVQRSPASHRIIP